MKIHGYPIGEPDPTPESSKELAEITLCATPAQLRRIAEFLVACADEMGRLGDRYDHVHLGDRMKEFDCVAPHVVVFRAEGNGR